MDALSVIVNLLKPQAVGAKIIHGAGRWGVRYPAYGQPSFALVLKGSCSLAVDGLPPMVLEAGDFVLFPAMPGFTMASDAKVKPGAMKAAPAGDRLDEVFHGDATAEPSVSMVGGYFTFDPVNAPVLLELLPGMLRLRAGDPAGGGVALIVEHLQREAREKRPGRALVLARLIEVMLVEALRSAPAELGAAGLLAGLADARLAAALHGIHTRTAEPWTLATLAREAGMSRSSFAERFMRVVGMTPVNYLLQWRLAVAKDLLAGGGMSVGEAALAVGYESASGFSTAFRRETGSPPKEFLRAR
jgi:AraC-like DNA-binding protein